MSAETNASKESAITLANGQEFNRAEERIREYCEIEVYRDIDYRGGYDDHHNSKELVTAEDVEAANNLYANITVQDRRWLVGNRSIAVKLAMVPDLELGGISDAEWENVKSVLSPVLSEFLSIRNVKLAKTTKLLHLKRPHLVPILDSFVVRFLTGNDMEENLFSEEEVLQIAISSMEMARKDLIRNREGFFGLKKRLEDLPTPLTMVRMYDILCWTQEKWVKRGKIGAPRGEASKSLDQTRQKKQDELPGERMDSQASPKEFPPQGEITTIKEFRRVIAKAEGVIVITGSIPPKAHTPLCPLVTDDRFNQNVSMERGKKTRYYLRASLMEARKEFQAVPCHRCRPGGSFARANLWK